MFSTRTSLDRSLNALAFALDHARSQGVEVFDLTISNPTTAGIPYPGEAILQAIGDPRSLTYQPLAFGLPEARRAVAEVYASPGTGGPHAVDPERVVLTASTSEAYSLLFKLLCDPGDNLAVPQPSYPLFDHLAAFESVELVPYRLAYDGAWHIDSASLARAVGPRTRAILVVSPNNPTGSYLKRSELTQLASFGLPIICDEVFATYPLIPGEDRVLGILEETSVLVFLLSGLSKLAALPQMKLGWMIVGGPDALVTEALGRLELIADSFLSVGAPVQNALPALLANRTTASTAISARTKKNLARLDALVGTESTVTRLHVEGGWYATLRLPHLGAVDWSIALLEAESVYVHPGAFFGFADDAHVVVSLLTPEDAFAEGIRRIVSRVARMVEA